MSSRSRMYVAGGIAAILVLALFPAQMSVFALAWPPPEGAGDYFELLQDRPLVGLLSLDLLLMADWILLLPLWAALYLALRERAPRIMLLVLGLVALSTIMYFLSNTAFEMLSLSAQHAAAPESERAAILASGERALATFDGPWFTASYLLSGLAALLASIVMWQTPAFGRVVGGVGIAYGALQAIPPNFGTLGMIVSVASLLPMLVWLALLARKLLRLARAEGTASAPRAQAAV